MQKIFNEDAIDFMQTQDFINISKGRKVVIITDPPFNIGYHYKKYKDNLTEEEYYDYLDKLLTMYNFPFVIIHYPEALYKISFITGVFPERVISWVYNSNTARQHRDIGFFGVSPDLSLVKQPYKNTEDKRIKQRMESGIIGGGIYDWWNINQIKNVSKKNMNHPCIMPTKVMENIIGILPKDILVYDPFSGSGTTGIACKEYGVDFIGTEVDEDYAELANNRIEEAQDSVLCENKNVKINPIKNNITLF